MKKKDPDWLNKLEEKKIVLGYRQALFSLISVIAGGIFSVVIAFLGGRSTVDASPTDSSQYQSISSEKIDLEGEISDLTKENVKLQDQIDELQKKNKELQKQIDDSDSGEESNQNTEEANETAEGNSEDFVYAINNHIADFEGNSNGEILDSTNGKTVTISNKEYTNGVTWNVRYGQPFSINPNGEFKTLTFLYGRVDNSGTNSGSILIHLDSIHKETIQLDPEVDINEFSIPIEGVNKVKLTIKPPNDNPWKSTDYGLVEMKLVR